MRTKEFPYAYWTKALGLLIVVAGIISFIMQYQKNGVPDVNELAIGFSWGFVFIFFSREKTEDEMIQNLKFKALTRSIIVSFSMTHLYNYIFLNWRFKRAQDLILSISAYQFLAITLIMATVIFYYLRYSAALNDEK